MLNSYPTLLEALHIKNLRASRKFSCRFGSVFEGDR